MYPAANAWEAVPQRSSLLTLNTDSLEDEIKDNPWVKGVEVTKKWSSGIVLVEVEERVAVIDAELEGRRAIMAGDGTELPGLGRSDLESVSLDGERLNDILKTVEILKDNGVDLDSVDAVDAAGVQATVEGRRILFGEVVRDGQAKVLRDVMERNPDAALFDLRSPGRVVVSGTERDG
ncbi:MAG: FtsQ-type POTRA domain-containing protein [Actinomycetota bacterium]|nr:FtsQ-type POTRA domain-containing protein [Actinomycetota bacterium]